MAIPNSHPSKHGSYIFFDIINLDPYTLLRNRSAPSTVGLFKARVLVDGSDTNSPNHGSTTLIGTAVALQSQHPHT